MGTTRAAPECGIAHGTNQVCRSHRCPLHGVTVESQGCFLLRNCGLISRLYTGRRMLCWRNGLHKMKVIELRYDV